MSGNPRKFSEKIAIHQRKLHEEQNEFANIIAEVAAITRGTEPMAAYSNQWGAGSSSPGGYSAATGGNTGEVTGQRMPMIYSRGRSPGAGAGGHSHHSHMYHPYRSLSPQHSSPATGYTMRQQSPERPQMMQQYSGSHAFLVPPQDTSWRRTHSDPGIHASVMQPIIPNAHVAPNTPPQNNVSPTGSTIGDKSLGGYYLEPKMNAPQFRPRSCDNVPNISIHPSEAVAGPQIPISNNTGSLPDLPSSLLPAQNQGQQLEGTSNGKSSQYGHSGVSGAANANMGHQAGGGQNASVGPHQQRHSIQLPVQYAQGLFAGGTVGGGQNYIAYGVPASQTLNSPAYSHGSSPYQPESPRSAPSSPIDGGAGGSGDSPASPQAQAQSPGSPYYALQNQMQNINIDSQEPVFVMPQNSYFGVGTSYNVEQSPASNAYHQYSATQAHQQMQSQDQYSQQQLYRALLLRQSSGHCQPPDLTNNLRMQQRLAMSNSGQIPDIIFTGADGSISAGGAASDLNSGNYLDPVEMMSSDLRTSMDPVDLESLHGMNSEQGLNIDAASEDALRRDRCS